MNTDGKIQDKLDGAIGVDDMSEAANQTRGPLFFSFQELGQCLDLLSHLTDSSDHALLLIGERGVGKTSLLYQYQTIASDNWQLCRIDANPMLHPEQLLTLLARCYGVREDVEPLADQLAERFQDMSREGVRPVIAVDDAHQLPATTLVQLLRLSELAGESSHPRVVLFAAPDIKAQLALPELQAVDGQRLRELHLPLLNQEQTGAFVTFYLNGRGLGQVISFSPDQIQRLYTESQGIPGRIEVLIDRQIPHSGRVATPSDEVRQKSFRGLPLKWLIGAIAAVLLIVILVFQDGINSLFTDDLVVGEPQVIPLALPQETAEVVTSDVTSQVEIMEVQEETEPVRPLPAEPDPGVALQESPMSQTEQLEERGEAVEEVVAPEAAKDAELTASAGEAKQVSINAEKEAPKPPPKVMSDEVTSLPAESVAKQAEERMKLAEEQIKQAEEQMKLAEEQMKQDRPEPRAEKTASGIKREEWLRKQNPAHYTLQLVGVSEESAVLSFVKQHGIKGKAAYFKSQRQGRPWYSLLYGVYPDRKAAIAAKGKLPASLAKSGAWPRTFASVHKEIGVQ